MHNANSTQVDHEEFETNIEKLFIKTSINETITDYIKLVTIQWLLCKSKSKQCLQQSNANQSAKRKTEHKVSEKK